MDDLAAEIEYAGTRHIDRGPVVPVAVTHHHNSKGILVPNPRLIERNEFHNFLRWLPTQFRNARRLHHHVSRGTVEPWTQKIQDWADDNVTEEQEGRWRRYVSTPHS